jgi:hypothetical protein
MAVAAARIGHEDRLSIVHHLDEPSVKVQSPRSEARGPVSRSARWDG